MRSSLVALQLLLAFVLVWATSVPEEKKECCGPGVPPEQSCCPKDNGTSQEPGKTAETNSEEPEAEEEMPAGSAGSSFAGPAKLWKVPYVREEPTSEELEERGKEYRERMHKSPSPYEFMFLKEHALDYFNKLRSEAHYRPLEDTNVKVKKAIGSILTFTLFLVNTNCTKEEGRRLSTPWYEPTSTKAVPCVALPKHEQKKLKCRVSMFLDAKTRRTAVVGHECQPVVFWEDSEDTLDLSHLLDFSAMRYVEDF